MKVVTEHGPVEVQKRTSRYAPVPLDGWRVKWRGEHFVGLIMPTTDGEYQAVPTGSDGEKREAPCFRFRKDAVRFLAGVGRERERHGTWVER